MNDGVFFFFVFFEGIDFLELDLNFILKIVNAGIGLMSLEVLPFGAHFADCALDVCVDAVGLDVVEDVDGLELLGEVTLQGARHLHGLHAVGHFEVLLHLLVSVCFC